MNYNVKYERENDRKMQAADSVNSFEMRAVEFQCPTSDDDLSDMEDNGFIDSNCKRCPSNLSEIIIFLSLKVYIILINGFFNPFNSTISD